MGIRTESERAASEVRRLKDITSCDISDVSDTDSELDSFSDGFSSTSQRINERFEDLLVGLGKGSTRPLSP